ncbi:hypothetical protein O988_01447 [Pseudogymnoascus sp. VKM F-3808]|nr:hypothetical protein O988_01447 [Pseudogymnoascus sp. VKM F-3808]
MGVEPPFIYDSVKKDTTRHSYKDFDPKAVSRASMQSQPQKPKKDGPLVSFNKHPDSYLIMPSGKATGARVSASMKGRITETRMAVLFFRIFQLIAAIGALTTMVLITGVDSQMGWIMRIVPGISILHTSYGIYHLSRKPSGRTPGSSASYMLFASLCDASIMAFYAFGATTAYYRWDPKNGLWEFTNGSSATWSTWSKLQEGGPYIMKTLFFSAFLCFGIGALFHFITLILSIWLFILFRKIVNLPPDMNPLESNLTSRAHKRNKSSVSTMSAYDDDKRTSTQAAARSGDPYGDLGRPPTMPFMQTRNNSGASFSTYYSIPTSSSPRDSRLDLPSRQYQIPATNSPRASVSDLKRTSQSSLPSISPKRGSYAPVSTQDLADQYADIQNENWYSTDSLPRNRYSQPPSPVKSARSPTKARPQSAYMPLRDGFGTYEDINDADFDSDVGSTVGANPLSAHPVDSRLAQRQSASTLNRQSALGEISMNRSNTAGSSSYSGDVADVNGPQRGNYGDAAIDHTEQREQSDYRELTPQPLVRPGAAGKGVVGHSSDRDGIVKGSVGLKARYYGDLRAGTPPTLVGGVKGRQVSSGIDIGVPTGDGRRDVSGKIAEEGRGGGWGARFRKISGI